MLKHNDCRPGYGRKEKKTMSENEQQSYDVPSVEGLSQDEAITVLEKVNADIAANPNHPYMTNTHPQSKSFKAAITRLYELKNPEPEPQTNAEGEELIASCQFPQAHLKAMEQALDEKAGLNEEVQAKLSKNILQEVNLINSIVPGDIDIDEIGEPTPEKLEGYQQLRMLRQGDYTSLSPLIVKDARGLGMKPDKVEQIKYFLTTAEPGEPLSEDICNIIIRHIHKAKKLRANRGD